MIERIHKILFENSLAHKMFQLNSCCSTCMKKIPPPEQQYMQKTKGLHVLS